MVFIQFITHTGNYNDFSRKVMLKYRMKKGKKPKMKNIHTYWLINELIWHKFHSMCYHCTINYIAVVWINLLGVNHQVIIIILDGVVISITTLLHTMAQCIDCRPKTQKHEKQKISKYHTHKYPKIKMIITKST